MEPFYRYLVYLVIVGCFAALIDASQPPSVWGRLLALFSIGALPAAHIVATWYAENAIWRLDRRRRESWSELLLFMLAFTLVSVLAGLVGTGITMLAQAAMKSLQIL